MSSFFFPRDYFLTTHFLLSKEKVVYCAGGSWQIKEGAISGYLARKVVIWHLNDTYVPKIIKLYLLFSPHLQMVISMLQKLLGITMLMQSRKERMLSQAPLDETKFRSINRDSDLNNKEIITIGTVCNVNPCGAIWRTLLK